MARIALISCNTTMDPYPIYPLGLTLVADAARRAGHSVAEFDLLVDGTMEGLARSIHSEAPDYIGLSLRNVDSVNYIHQESYTDDYRTLVNALRQVSNAPIILGGSAYSIFPEALLQATDADYGIPGEGEKAFAALIDRLESGESVPSGIFSETPLMHSEEIPVGARNERLADYYLRRGGMLNLQTKRGCPHQCLYCSYPHLEGKHYRFRPPADIAEEFDILIRCHHADYVSITDSVFNDARGHYLTIAEMLVRKSLKVRWMCFMRPQSFTDDEIALLKASGLSAVEWGTDAASDLTLAGMQKSFTWSEVIDSNNRFAAQGIACSHFIIFGGPGESAQTVNEGLRNIEQLNQCVVFASTGIRVFPHTPVYAKLQAEAAISPDLDLLKPYFYFSPDISAQELDTALRQAFNGRQDRIYPDGEPGQREKIQAFHDLGYRGPLWDLILKSGKTRRV